MATPRLDAVLDHTIALARNLVAADAYAIWRQDVYAREWCAEASIGLSDELKADILATMSEDMEELPFTEPLTFDNLESSPLVARRREAYRRGGIKGLLIVPLTIAGAAAARSSSTRRICTRSTRSRCKPRVRSEISAPRP